MKTTGRPMHGLNPTPLESIEMANIKENGRDLTPYVKMMDFPGDPGVPKCELTDEEIAYLFNDGKGLDYLPMDPAKVRAMLEPEEEYRGATPLSTKIALGVFVLLLIAAIAWPIGIALAR